MSPRGNARANDKIVDAALQLAAERGWRNVGLGDVAVRAEIPFAELYDATPSKRAIEEVFSRRIDKEMLAKVEDFDPAQIIRDRIFDVMMQRFEALEPYRQGTKAIFRELTKDPIALIQRRSSILRSMAAILEASNIDSDDLTGSVRAHALAVIWLCTFQIWQDDDTDLSKTMAQLDRQLRRTESYVHTLKRAFGNVNSNIRTAE